MKKLLLTAVLTTGLLWAAMPLAARKGCIPRKMLRDSLPVMTERCAAVLRAAYMEQTFVREDRRTEGWEGYPVRLYEYRTGYDSTVGGPKKAKVLLLDPSPRKLALWILTACWEAKGSIEYRYTEKMRKTVLYQSGGQFPVAGIVYEAMYKAGDYVPYLFRDGVTVWPADSTLQPGRGHLDEERLEGYLRMRGSDLRSRTGRFARIIGTTPGQYVACGGKEEVGTDSHPTQRWLDVVRELYKKAWKSDRNELMIVWARCNL
ncbi:cellulase [uncultured Alistipes sp.]|uniref:cellulase n=1 Tax=uncultured Alistipes sp. TaxID=538949 RepID=UPI002629B333|nr:cellulase [uncultured Alistipes sp.]